MVSQLGRSLTGRLLILAGGSGCFDLKSQTDASVIQTHSADRQLCRSYLLVIGIRKAVVFSRLQRLAAKLYGYSRRDCLSGVSIACIETAYLGSGKINLIAECIFLRVLDRIGIVWRIDRSLPSHGYNCQSKISCPGDIRRSFVTLAGMVSFSRSSQP